MALSARTNRIDVHHHVLPSFYIEAQRAAGITGTAYRGFPEWSPAKSIASNVRFTASFRVASSGETSPPLPKRGSRWRPVARQ